MWNISTIYISNHLRASVTRAIPWVQLQPRSKTVEKALWMRLIQLYWLAEANHRQLVRSYRLWRVTVRHRSCACLTLALWKYRTTFNFATKKTRHTNVSIQVNSFFRQGDKHALIPSCFTRKTLDKNTTNEYAESKKLSATKLKLVVYQFGDIIGSHRFLRWVVRRKPMPVNPSDLTDEV